MVDAISPNPERGRPSAPADHGGMRSGRAPFPAPLTSLVGREREIDHVRSMLRRRDIRLITLTGPGGVGKTRLALALATDADRDYPGGVVFLPLAAVRDPQLVAAEVAHAFGISEPGNAPFADQMAAAVGDAEALLVVDNFEHLLPAAPVLTEVLGVCPGLTLLVTSRERLRLSGEHDVPVLPLSCPDPEDLANPARLAAAPAVRLFVERSQEVSPRFVLTEANGAAVAAICDRLDGLPLALELAAARGTHLPPAALLARLARRLPLLTGGPRDAPARLRTMRDAITWSHDLLSTEEKALFRRIAVFAPGFSLDAVEAVCADRHPLPGHPDSTALDPSTLLLDLVASLVDKSLLRPAATRIGDPIGSTPPAEPRFELLETIREFGLECLAESDEASEVRTAHAAYYLSLVERISSCHRDNGVGLSLLEAEHANIRAALDWCGSGGAPGVAIQLAARLGQFWFRRGYQVEGRGWLERALAAAPDANPAIRTAALNALGDLQRDLGEPTESRRSFVRA
ncbi:MAG: AAA family ATPase, partial [Propionibacteriaceae bacterium]|nr:AAA family ATPase [Propionibacteriaceae bacterium]